MDGGSHMLNVRRVFVVEFALVNVGISQQSLGSFTLHRGIVLHALGAITAPPHLPLSPITLSPSSSPAHYAQPTLPSYLPASCPPTPSLPLTHPLPLTPHPLPLLSRTSSSNLIQKLLCFINLTSQVRAATLIWMIQEHELPMMFPYCRLIQVALGELEDEGSFSTGDFRLEPALVVRPAGG